MTRIILVRHGQTAWNRVERFRGRADLPLDGTGQSQAHAVARRIVSSWRVAAVYASPVQRALQTAQAIAQRCGVEVQPCEGLVDIDYGQWQGKTLDEVAASDPEQLALWQTTPHKARIPGGETLGKVRRRAMQSVLEIAERHPDQTVVLVSHLVVCRLMILSIFGLPSSRLWHIYQETAALNVFEYDNGVFSVRTLNDTCHLREM